METQTSQYDEQQVGELYQSLLSSWNNSNATAFANLFAVNGNAIGFDGSQMNGRRQIEEELTQVFTNHQVAAYVSIVKEIRLLAASVYLLRAVAGMVPPGGSAINPKVNAIQTLIATKEQGRFLVAVFQNTPAAFHERPELSKQLTEELQEAFNKQKNG